MTSPGRSSVLLGMHPQYEHSPPTSSRSTIAAVRPPSATRPAAGAPRGAAMPSRGRSSVLPGTHPQSDPPPPPTPPPPTAAVSPPSAPRPAAVPPAGPAPITTTSYSATVTSPPGLERGLRPRLQLAVDVEVDLLVVEADPAGHLLALGHGAAVAPHDVLVAPLRSGDRPVRGGALVRAAGLRRGRLQQVEPHVAHRQVVARRQARLEEDHRPLRVGHRDAVDLDPHVPGAGEDVDPVVRVAGMDVD